MENYVLVIDWRDADANRRTGGTKLTIREGGLSGKLLNDGGKVNFKREELEQAFQMAMRQLANAKSRFVNRKANPPAAKSRLHPA